VNEAIYKQPLILFLGAGASAPLGKMTTLQFLEWLKSQELRIPAFVNAAEQHLRGQGKYNDKLDVEAILDFIEDLVNSGELFHHYGGEDLLRERDKLARQIDEFRGALNQPKISFAKPVPAIYNRQENEVLLQHIKDLVVSHYSEIDSQKAFELYSPLFESILLIRPLSVFTTNYDLSWEKTYELTSTESYQLHHAPFTLIDGFRRHRVATPHWLKSEYHDYSPSGADIILFKLHGSVDWVRTPTGAIQRVESQRRDPGGMKTIIIYPSQRKWEIHEEPFRTNYNYLLACLLHAKLCAVIGFSFRDQEIVEEFRQALQLNKALELMIIDPNAEIIKARLKNKFGFDPRAELIREEFSREAASHLADKMKGKIK